MLRLLEDEPQLSQREISERLGVSLGSVNFCVKALVDKGLIKVNNFRRSDNKLAYAYVLTPHGVAERVLATRKFLLRKLEEYEQIKKEIEILKLELESTGSDEKEETNI